MMDHFYVILIAGLVPQPCCATERCGTIELNHIVSATGVVTSYWLGRRDIRECELVWIVDWWRPHKGEEIWPLNRGVMLLIMERDGSLIVVQARRWRQTWTDYDVEVEQRRELRAKYGADDRVYRRRIGRGTPRWP